jgi:hypothetical protein
MEAIDDEVDSYIATFQNKGAKKELAETIYNSKKKKLQEISAYMSKKYEK